MQTLDEMSKELLQRGIDGTKLIIAPPEGSKNAAPVAFEGEPLKALMLVLDELEEVAGDPGAARPEHRARCWAESRTASCRPTA